MSLAVFLKDVSGLRGRYDRIARVTFRDKTYTSDVYEFCTDPLWEEEFDWKVNGKLKATDFIEIQIFNYSRLFRSRFVARYQMFLKTLLEEQWISITDNLVDKNYTVLNAKISIEVIYTEEYPRECTFVSFHPVEVPPRVLEDWELASQKSGSNGRRGSKFSLTSSLKRKFGSLASIHSSKKDAVIEFGEVHEVADAVDAPPEPKVARVKKGKPKEKEKERFNLHPKVRVQMKSVREDIDFNVQIRVTEAKYLAGTQLDPVCDIICFGETKHTQIKEQTNTPFWDEFFVFDTIGQWSLIFDEMIVFNVYTARSMISKGILLGSFKIDLGTIYYQPDHRFIRKYACLTHPDETLGASGAGIKGYLKLDITVLAKGDPIKEPPNTKDGDADVDENPLLPENVKPERLRTRICLRIYKAEGLPKMNSGILAVIRKQFTGESRIRDLADPFVTLKWAGLEASTSVKYKSYDPEWVEEVVFCDLFPSLCRRIKIQLKDRDATGSETIGTCWIDLSEISNDGCNVNKFSLNSGFMPTFGPAWVNLYGSTRDYSFIDQNHFLNEGMEEGIGYRGRLLLGIETEEGESASDDNISNTNVKAATPVSDMVGGKEETFQLFCCIYEASMIDRKTASKPIQFEMNIGNNGNTIDGKMISWKDDDEDDEEDEEDKFVQPLTAAATAESVDREYYYMPFQDTKPCMHMRFLMEDQRKRLYLQNILHHYMEKLEDSLEDVYDRMNIDADDTYEYLRDSVKLFIESSTEVIGQLSGKITGPKAGRTKLDKERLALCIAEAKRMKEEAEEVLSGLKDNSRIRGNYNYVISFRDRIKKLMKEPQESTPDIFIWLLSNRKRKAYVRIPAHKIIYSTIPHESGSDSGKVQTYCLTLPGKSGRGSNGWAIQCKLTCLLWFGVLKNKRNMLLSAPEGFELPHGLSRSTAPPPKEIVYTERHTFLMRAHIYQARGLIGSDDSGLSDAFARVIFNEQAADTTVVWETRNPTWNQTLLFRDLVIWGDNDAISWYPPTIIIEIFDFDAGGDIEFIGRSMARPLVKLLGEPYSKPLFPPKLEWFDIFRGDSQAGELLAAFEMFELSDDPDVEMDLPAEPVEMEDSINGGVFLAIPGEITPVMAPHRIECLFWGVREMKRISLQAVDRPQVELECIGEAIKSPMIPSAKKNPNFLEPWAYIDLDLPYEDRYCPPLTISVKDTRIFGKEILVGTCIVNSLLTYLQDGSELIDGEDDKNENLGESNEEVKEKNEESNNEPDTNVDSKGQENEGFEDDQIVVSSETPLVAGSRKGSIFGSIVPSILSKRNSSRAPSQAGSKAVSFSDESKPPSKIASKKSTPIIKVSNEIECNRRMSPAEISMASRRRSSNPYYNSAERLSIHQETLRRGSHSSQIHYHIRSNPGTPFHTPLKKILTPRKSPGKISANDDMEGSPSETRLGTEMTPLKTVIENEPYATENEGNMSKQSPTQSIVGSTMDINKPSSTKGSHHILTPRGSVGSKLATPLHSKRGSRVSNIGGSQAGSQNKSNGSHSKLNEKDEEIELDVGAEASTFLMVDFPDLTETREDGDGAETGKDDSKDVPGGGAPDGTAGEPAPPPPVILPDLDGEESEEEGEKEEMKVIMVGEDELKAEEAALAAEAEEEDDEEDAEGEGEDEDEDQVDWWSRFYETIKDEERAAEERKLKEKKKKKGKKAVQVETEEEEEEVDLPVKNKKIINPKIIRLKIYKTELEEVSAFDGFNDVLQSFTLLRGKSSGNDEEDESRFAGKFKGAIKVWKYPLPKLFYDENITMGSFKMLPTMDPVNILCRVYVVKAIDLHPTDLDGKADPYVKLQVGKQVKKDRENYVPKQLNPSFGRVFDFEVIIPHDNLLTVGIYDYDLVGKDDLIGETKIDIENRFFSRHRATCGMSLQYAIQGFNKWRDPIKPTAILQRLCKDHKLDGPHFQPGRCRIEKWVFCASETITDDNGNPKQSDEPCALKALHNFQMIDQKGYPLVPEHVETRSLLHPGFPGIEQGRIQMWVDLFDMDGPSPGAAAVITPRKPTSFELRCIIWNTEDVILGDINILTGQPCADIYVKGWVEGLKENKQQTDIHATSLTGEGNFNWRFIFPFKYHKAEEKVVIVKKASMFSWDTSEEKMPPRLVLQCWDSDALSSDDFIGDVTLNLTNIPRPAKTAIQCNIETMDNENKDSIFKKKQIKGWWPFILNTEESEPEVVGKVEAQLELLTEQEAEEDPAGLGRREPNPLPFPDRPDVMMQWMMNPLKALRYFLWEQYKFCLAKFAVLFIIFAIMGLFLYTMPGYIVKKMFGA